MNDDGLCRVYWGSHGCMYKRGHRGHCRCECADDPVMQGYGNVGGHPYYGPTTRFYGEDVASRGLPTSHDDD
jgi:hypothetical protein